MIKEVSNVTFYEIKNDGTDGAPVLFLDTLKVSTIEQTAETTEARGGYGNPVLIIWDYNKEINVTLEDALFSQKSLNLMFGSGEIATPTKVKKVLPFVGATKPSNWYGPDGTKYTVPASATVYDEAGETVTTPVAGTKYYIAWDETVATGKEITISGDSFPGVYKMVGETFARSQETGKDELRSSSLAA